MLKIDVEGHETEVLRGASNLLRTKQVRHIIYESMGQYPGARSSASRRCGFPRCIVLCEVLFGSGSSHQATRLYILMMLSLTIWRPLNLKQLHGNSLAGDGARSRRHSANSDSIYSAAIKCPPTIRK